MLFGNINAAGNVFIGGGTFTGSVTHPDGTSYIGPLPSGGNIIAPPLLPQLPALPKITSFPAAGTQTITGTQTIKPGSYADLVLYGNKTITLSGTGTYVFKSIRNRGANNMVFDFKNAVSGTFKIYVYGDVDLDKITASVMNGGDAGRIFTETHGAGSTCAEGKMHLLSHQVYPVILPSGLERYGHLMEPLISEPVVTIIFPARWY